MTVIPERFRAVDARVAPRRALGSVLVPQIVRLGVGPALVVTDVAALSAAVLPFRSWVVTLLVPGVLLLFSTTRLYRPRLDYSILDHLPVLAGRILLAGTTLAAVLSLRGSAQSRAVVQATLLAVGLVTLSRCAAYSSVRQLRRSRAIEHRTVILGGGHVAGQLAGSLLEHSEYGMRPVGFVDDDPLLGVGERPVPLLGGFAQLRSVLQDVDATNVVVAFGSLRESMVVDVLRTCDRMACEIFYVPRLYELTAVDEDVDLVWGIPLLRLRRAAFRTRRWQMKRTLDVVGAALGLVLVSPLMALCALAVRLETGPTVLFRQRRVGIDGHPFVLLKFRTFRPPDPDEEVSRWNIDDDSRIGPVGRLLRKTSLDELPQLWNVLRGDMSLVGPRPERPNFVSEFTARYPRYVARHRVPAGITGEAQVHGLRGDTSIEDRARFDNYYIESWSLWGDCKIILRTLGQVARRSSP